MGFWSATVMSILGAMFAVWLFQTTGTPMSQTLPPDALAANMLVYHQTALNYLIANPALNGTVPEGSMVFPTWYVKAGPWISKGSAKVLTTYSNGAMQIPATALAKTLQKYSGDGTYNGGDIGTGVTSAAGFIVPALMVSSVATPAGVPVGVAVVYSQIQ